jgi:DNA replication and repair protein RecF
MLQIDSITLTQFKNYINRSFIFQDRLIGIFGKNGVGKTNLLDAIHYLCFTKSYFTRLDTVNVHHGSSGFRIEGNFRLLNKEEKTVCILRENGRKEFSVNGELYDKFSQHIGRYPCVVIAPDDVQLIIGGSEERRTFIDMLLSQLDPDYLQQLIIYNKILLHRNSLLRSFADPSVIKDYSLMDVLDEQLIKPGESLFEKRKSFLVSFLPIVKKLYNEISRQYEDINLFYESELLQISFPQLLQLNRKKDIMAMRTIGGAHRDDLAFLLGAQLFKNIASQGQRKSLLFALKLAEMTVLKDEKGFAPLLLLDDVFEKLDEDRISNLLQRVCTDNDGQVFITDTNGKRIEQQLQSLQQSFQLIELK